MLPNGIGGTELLLIAAVALIVVGPKELPVMLRKLGQFIGKMRRIASDFRSSFDDMAKQSELDDLRKQVEEMRSQASQLASGDPTGLTETFNDFHSGMDPSFNYGAEPEPEPAPTEPAAVKPRKRAAARAPATKPIVETAGGKSAPRKRAAKNIVT